MFEVFVWILLNVNLSLNQPLLTFLLCVREIWMTQLIWVVSLWEVTFALIWKDSVSHMHEPSFAWDLSLENSTDSYLCFQLSLLHSMSYFFFLYWSPSSSLWMAFDAISSTIGEMLSINLSVNVFVLKDFNAHF